MINLNEIFGLDDASKLKGIENDANCVFTIRRIDGLDYIYYYDVRISNMDDAANSTGLLNRLEYYKRRYVEARAIENKIKI